MGLNGHYPGCRAELCPLKPVSMVSVETNILTAVCQKGESAGSRRLCLSYTKRDGGVANMCQVGSESNVYVRRTCARSDAFLASGNT